MRVDLVLANWQLFASGVWLTLQLTFLALAIGFCIALPAGIARARRKPIVSPLINAYVYVFRGTPLIVQTFLIYFGLGQFEWIRDSWAWSILRDPWWCALIAFSLNSAAYSTEIIRGAVENVPQGRARGRRRARPVAATSRLPRADPLGAATGAAAVRQRGGVHAARHRRWRA